MCSVAKPIIKQIRDNREALDFFETVSLPAEDEKTQAIIMNFPTVYIHNWQDSGAFEVYVGETNNIFKRTRQHYDAALNQPGWRSKLSKKDASLFIIGHEHFNKSMTLDIENRLIHYLMSAERIKKVHNGRSNPQNRYYPIEELNYIFTKIWRKLRKDNKEIFPLETTIKDSAIFKASPLHKLTEEQQKAKELIIEKVIKALKNDERGQLIFIEGEAGTGKTVLNSSTFYELFCRYEESKNNNEDLIDETSNCFLLVNHDEQITVYNQIANKLGLTDKYGQVVYKPTSFINKYSIDNPVDVVFVDEAHLLLTQGKQSYRGNNQLEDILKRARVVVVMFDEDQILTTEQYWEDELLEKYKNIAIKNGNYIKLENQLRMHANEDVIEWINTFTKEGIIRQLPADLGDYEIKIFDTPEELEEQIVKKSLKDETKLSRLIATYDWPYNSNKKSKKDFKYWKVKIGKWHKPWNRELEQDLDRKQKREIKKLSWAEQPQTIKEVGSTFTIQGFDLNYSGVILGPSVKYRNGHIVFDTNESYNEKATRNRTLSDGTSKKFGEKLLKHEVRVLMTRGVNGLYIYACDDELREHLKKCSYKEIRYEINEGECLKVAEDSEEYKYE